MHSKLIQLLIYFSVLILPFLQGCESDKPIDWGDYNVLKQKPLRPYLPEYNGKRISKNEYMQWVYWGEKWFREETFGNEIIWTDVVGLLQGTVDIPQNTGFKSEPVLKYFLQSIALREIYIRETEVVLQMTLW